MRIWGVASACFVGTIVVGCSDSGTHGTNQRDGGTEMDGSAGTPGAGDAAGSSAGTSGSGGRGASGAAAAGGATDGGAGTSGSGGRGANGGSGSGAGGAAGSNSTSDAGAVDPYGDGPMIAVASMVYELGTSPLIVMPRLPLARGAAAPSCTPMRYGDCIVDNCKGVDPNAPRLSAGTIRVDSDDAGIHVAAIPGVQGDYSMTTGDKAFAGGESFTVSATGADIPAFSVDMKAPLLLLVDGSTQPTASPTTVAVPAPHGAPLKLSWTRGAPGVFLVLQSLDIQGFGARGTVSARCFFDSQAGTATVPAAVLSDVMVGQQFVLLTATSAVVEGGTEPLGVWLLGEALTSDKKAAVVLQVQ